MIEGINKAMETIRPEAAAMKQDEVSKLIKPENKELETAVSKNEKGKKVDDECQTCKNRVYVDGSDDPDVSFKTPQHVDPAQSFAAVSSHEKEHVSEAERQGSEEGNKLLRASVQLHTAVCPECGRVYVAGGVTRTTIQYSNPYAKKDDSYKEGLKGLKVNDTF